VKVTHKKGFNWIWIPRTHFLHP